MPKQKVNFRNPNTGKRECGCRDTNTDRVHNSKGEEWDLKELEKFDKNGVGFFETHSKGKLIQRIGKFINGNNKL